MVLASLCRLWGHKQRIAVLIATLTPLKPQVRSAFVRYTVLRGSYIYAVRSIGMIPDGDTLKYSDEELCSRIAILTRSIMDFWSDGGWAQLEAAELLDRSMLRWQASLAQSLTRWIDATSEGDLILAWANLGALVEGQLRLFLCVYYHDYRSDPDAIRNHEGLIDPDECKLERLRQFFVKRIWDVGTDWNPYVEMVQKRRNAIHAFRRKDIGTFQDWAYALRLHLSFVRDTGGGLPYPDQCFGGLREE